MFKIAYYEIKKMVRNYRFLVILFLEPIVLIALLGSVNYYEPRDISVGLVNLDNNKYSTEVTKSITDNNSLKIEIENTEESLVKKIKTDKYRSAVVINIAQNSDGETVGKITITDNQTVPEMSLRAREKILESIKIPISNIVVSNSEKKISTTSNNKVQEYNDKIKASTTKLSQSVVVLEQAGIDTKDILGQINEISSYKVESTNIEIVSEPVKV
jgi:hypothetical protein